MRDDSNRALAGSVKPDSKTDAGGRGLLARARQFVADSGCDEDDMDVNLARVELLQEIDAALAAPPPSGVREALEREEKYLHDLIDNEDVGSVMHGDLEGAFHRICSVLAQLANPQAPSPTSPPQHDHGCWEEARKHRP